MPALIAAPWLGTAIAGIATGTGAVVGAKMQSGAANRAARAQSQSANYGADRQLEASREAERFARAQAQAAYQQAEADRRANYEQWASRERRLGSIAESLGYGRRDIPGYVPSVDPRFVDPSTQMPQGGPVSTAQPVPVGSGQSPAAAFRAQQPMSTRDALMARKFPQGSVGAMVLARQRRPMGAGV